MHKDFVGSNIIVTIGFGGHSLGSDTGKNVILFDNLTVNGPWRSRILSRPASKKAGHSLGRAEGAKPLNDHR